MLESTIALIELKTKNYKQTSPIDATVRFF